LEILYHGSARKSRESFKYFFQRKTKKSFDILAKLGYLQGSKKKNEYEKKFENGLALGTTIGIFPRCQGSKSQTATGASQGRTGKQSHCGFPRSRKEKRRNCLTFRRNSDTFRGVKRKTNMRKNYMAIAFRNLKARQQQEQVRKEQVSKAIAAFLKAGKKNEEIV
jgi:hypothetical protein